MFTQEPITPLILLCVLHTVHTHCNSYTNGNHSIYVHLFRGRTCVKETQVMDCDVLEGVREEGEAGWIRSGENLNMVC